jgi:hypothetical protein
MKHLSRCVVTLMVAAVALLAPVAHAQDAPGVTRYTYRDVDGLGQLIIQDICPGCGVAAIWPPPVSFIRVSLLQGRSRFDGSGTLEVVDGGPIEVTLYRISFALAAPRGGVSYFFEGLVSEAGGSGTYHRTGFPERTSAWRVLPRS